MFSFSVAGRSTLEVNFLWKNQSNLDFLSFTYFLYGVYTNMYKFLGVCVCVCIFTMFFFIWNVWVLCKQIIWSNMFAYMAFHTFLMLGLRLSECLSFYQNQTNFPDFIFWIYLSLQLIRILQNIFLCTHTWYVCIF